MSDKLRQRGRRTSVSSSSLRGRQVERSREVERGREVKRETGLRNIISFVRLLSLPQCFLGGYGLLLLVSNAFGSKDCNRSSTTATQSKHTQTDTQRDRQTQRQTDTQTHATPRARDLLIALCFKRQQGHRLCSHPTSQRTVAAQGKASRCLFMC